MKAHHTLALKVVNVLKDKFAKAYCVKTNRMKSTPDQYGWFCLFKALQKKDKTRGVGNQKTLTFVIKIASLCFWTNSLERI